MCFMVGHEMGCGHCKAGYMLDVMTMTCMPDQPTNNGPNGP
jgi:hypothetical protein